MVYAAFNPIMRWSIGYTDLFKWHSWYAWHPVTIAATDEWVWLERIQRRMFATYGGGGWKYREDDSSYRTE